MYYAKKGKKAEPKSFSLTYKNRLFKDTQAAFKALRWR